MTSTTRTKLSKRKLFASLICGLFISFLLIIEGYYGDGGNELKNGQKEPQACYMRTPGNKPYSDYEIEYLDDIMNGRKLSAGENIFFHETTCSPSSLVHLSSRQACAIESAAKWNPNRNVFVLFASPAGFRMTSVSTLPTNIKLLKTYPNVHLRNNNIWNYAKGTPLEKWLSNGTLFDSMYLFEHMSDVLRFLTLYKFGGTFLDLDVIVQKSFDLLGPNFAGDDSVDAIGCGVLNFGQDKVGRQIADNCIRFLIEHFNGNQFIDNGPLVITSTLERVCGTKNRDAMTREQCNGFRVYPKSAFYAISWSKWKWFFDATMTDRTLEMTKNSTVIHVWNDVSKNAKIKIGDRTAYEMAAKINCPKIYRSRVNHEYF